MTDKLLNTGLPTLDNELEGGSASRYTCISYGRFHDHGRDFLYQFIQQRNSYYVNTERRRDYIITNLKKYGYDESKVKFIDVHEKYYEISDIISCRWRDQGLYDH